MAATTTALPRDLFAVVGAGLVALVLGAVLAAGILRGGSHDTHAAAAPAAPKDGYALGDPVPTRFGVVAVESVDKNAGPSAKQLNGVTHGISGLVSRDKAQVQAFATITNRSKLAVEYSPAQFSLVAGRKDAKPTPLTSASIKPGTLQPAASIDARLSFVVPRRGQKLWMRYSEPGAKAPVFIDLGRVSKAPRGAATTSHGDHR